MTTYLNHLAEVVLMRYHNIFFLRNKKKYLGIVHKNPSLSGALMNKSYPELQIRGGNEDISKIIFHTSQ